MRALFLTCLGLLILAVLITGCTNRPAPALPTTVPTATTSVWPDCVLPVPPPDTLTSATWTLAWYDDTRGMWTRVIEGSTITATFFNEGRVTGSGGCNGYSTDYQLGNESRIWFRRPVVPDNLCQSPTGVMLQESEFFTDLERAETYAIMNGKLLVYDVANKTILQFDSSYG